jgi:biopolymer transport protein ExbB
MWMEIASAFQHGDGYIYFMLALAFFGTMILFERVIMLQFVLNLDFHKFLNNLKKAVKAEDLDRAATICRSAGKSSLPAISLKAIEAAEADPSTVRGTIEEEAISFLPRIDARTGTLPALATLILLTGVLGTINALWKAFHSIDVLDSAQKQAMVGHGIASSLTYASLGLMIAMLFLMGHHMIRGMAMRLLDRFQHGITVLNNLLVPAEMSFVQVSPAGPVPAPPVDMGPVDVPAAPQPQTPVAAAPVAEAKGKDGFEEASVEDIKDEEEII